ncbi:MAG: hypothetical protein H6823_13355 [Planctomycetaceae bacterium]|nr:hypothetical protein [Planctomycetaceae bacterium]
MKHSTRPLSFACALFAALSVQTALAVHERFESVEVSWRLADSDTAARLVSHERDFTVAHSGKGSEHIRLWSGQGTYAYLAHPVAPARIIGELVPSLWVKADQPGLRLLLRVVLPRAKTRDGKTLTIMLDGEFYTQPGAWQRLHVRDLKKTLEAQVRIHRLRGPVDEREAYIDHVVLNAYTGPGTTEIWTDDLELVGYAAASRETTAVGLMDSATHAGPVPHAVERTSRSAELRGSVLLVEQLPYFAKVIEHNGEPFSWLKEIGFNTALLRSPPSAAQLAEADEADLWLVAPPAISDGVLDPKSTHRRVIAWRLGAGASAAEAAAIGNLAAQVRRQDSETARPILCDLSGDIFRYSRIGDVLMFGRSTLGSSFDLMHYGDWLAGQMRPLAGKPIWGTVETEPSSRLVDQLAIANASSLNSRPIASPLPKLGADPEQIRLLAFETIAAGARGVCFRSRSRLDLDDDVAKLRVASLRLVNAELTLVEPWAAGGSFSEALDMREPNTRARFLETDRSRLLVVTRLATGQQYVPHATSEEPLSFVAHSIPITDQAYHLGVNGLQPLLRSQTTGPRIAIQNPESVSLVLFTQDPLAINRSTRVLSENRKQAATLRLQIATLQMRQTLDIVDTLGRMAPAKPALDESRAMLDRAEQLLRGGDSRNAMGATRTAQRLIRRVQREAWEEAILAFPSPTSSVLCSSFATLPLHAEATNRLATATWENNVLRAGDCEGLEAMLRSGWRQQAPERNAESTFVELSVQDPAGGRSALHMISRRPSKDAVAGDDAALSIISAPIEIAAGQSFRVHGWVKVPEPITGSNDALMIYDSFSGKELAERITHTNGWREFTLYRIATYSGELTLTFALTGFGEVWLDEVTVAVLRP